MTVRSVITRLTQQEDLNFLLTNRIPRRWSTQFMGWLSRIEQPWLCAACIALWRLFTDLDLSEARETRFRSLHDCFTRRQPRTLRFRHRRHPLSVNLAVPSLDSHRPRPVSSMAAMACSPSSGIPSVASDPFPRSRVASPVTELESTYSPVLPGTPVL